MFPPERSPGFSPFGDFSLQGGGDAGQGISSLEPGDELNLPDHLHPALGRDRRRLFLNHPQRWEEAKSVS